MLRNDYEYAYYKLLMGLFAVIGKGIQEFFANRMFL
jgi:hypothetical protein